MWVRNCWYVAGWGSELAPGALMARTIISEPLMLYRASDEAVVAMEDRCCHRFAPLSKGRLEGDDVRCLYHGLKFDRTGRCIEIPGQDTIARNARVRTFPVVERHSWIWVWMGDADKADAGLIPQAIGLDDPDWTFRTGQMDYEASYQLINDNLTDFSHLSYVHSNSFGATEVFARTRPNIELLDRGVRIWRWIENGGTSDRPHRRADGEGFQTYDFLAPGVLLMHTVTCAPGARAKFDSGKPDLSQVEILAENFTSQAVTPITERTTRYFFSWGPRASEGSEAVADAMQELAFKAFGEDKDMIEAQQRIIDFDPARKEVLTSADAGPMQMRSVIQRLCRDEGQAAASAA